MFTKHLPHSCVSLNVIRKMQTNLDGIFNEFFSTVGPKLANDIPVLDNGVTIHDYLGHPNINSIFLNPISEQEVITIVKSCKPKNSKDCDDMYVLSKVIETIVKPLAHIFNLSFSSGIFPDDMKIAKIIPLFKNGRQTGRQFLFYLNSLKFLKSYLVLD